MDAQTIVRCMEDGTAMLLLTIGRDMPIDVVMTADTGMEFPEMYEHIVRPGGEKLWERDLVTVRTGNMRYDRAYPTLRRCHIGN